MDSSKDIQFLLKKYKTKQPGETNKAHPDAMKNWRLQKKIRYAQEVMNQLHIQGTSRSQVIYLIEDILSTNYLCKKCTCETVITGLCFYVKFANTRKEKLERYQLAREHGLTEERYSAIVTRIAKHYHSQRSLHRVVEEV